MFYFMYVTTDKHKNIIKFQETKNQNFTTRV